MPTTTINGHSHYYEDQGTGEVLVMLHGANGASSLLAYHWPELSQHFRVIAPDMRSMGQSEHVTSLDSPSAWVEDLEALLDHLGIEKAHIFGVSLGSRVGMRFCIEHPERVLSLTVTAPHTYLNAELNGNMNRSEGDAGNLTAEEQERMAKLHGEDWAAVVQNYYNIRNDAGLQHYYNLRVSKPLAQVVGEFSDPVTRIKCPILVIQSDEMGQGRGTFDHAIELKNEMPDQVHLAVVPSWDHNRSVAGEPLRMLMRQFIASLPVTAGAAGD
jgi:pimeloyl-ACP methyl ester carboxylesterase